jgi:hypothetical protein
MLKLAALVLALLAGPAWAQERTMSVRELAGLSRTEVAQRLGLPAAASWTPSFAGVTTAGPATFARPETTGAAGCDGWLALRVGDSGQSVEAFLFRDDRLAAVIGEAAPTPHPIPAGYHEVLRASEAAKGRPAGPLPIAAGVDAYVAQAMARALSAGETIRSRCQTPLHIARSGPPRVEALQAPLDAAFELFGLIYWSPVYLAQGIDRADAHARKKANGPVLEALAPGAPLPGGEAGFRARKGVRWHTDAGDPGYAVATLDLGGGRQRNYVVLGVRDGRVQWIGPLNGPMGLCQGADGEPSAARKGCSTTGWYNPA